MSRKTNPEKKARKLLQRAQDDVRRLRKLEAWREHVGTRDDRRRAARRDIPNEPHTEFGNTKSGKQVVGTIGHVNHNRTINTAFIAALLSTISVSSNRQ